MILLCPLRELMPSYYLDMKFRKPVVIVVIKVQRYFHFLKICIRIVVDGKFDKVIFHP
jgi:hypothetical protein